GTPTAGAELTYTITATNLGPSDTTDTVTVTDTIPATPSGTTFQRITPPNGWTCNTPAVGSGGTVTCTIGSLAANASGTFTLVVKLASSATGTISNSASIGSSTTDPKPLASSNSASTAASAITITGDLVASKTGAPNPVVSGDELTYTIVATNDGPSDIPA